MNFHAIQQNKRQFKRQYKQQFESQCESRCKRQSGFSLIEVMIAALVISIGMLGLAGLQLVSMKGSHQSYMRHQAMFLVQDLVERMRANPNGVRISAPSSYLLDTQSSAPNCAATPTVNCGASGATCNSDDLAVYDIHSVACKMRNSLMNGRIQVACQPVVAGVGGCADGRVGIQISWSERELGQETGDTIKATTDNLFPADTSRTDDIIIYTRIQ